jgi:hypothetical protein
MAPEEAINLDPKEERKILETFKSNWTIGKSLLPSRAALPFSKRRFPVSKQGTLQILGKEKIRP